MLHYRTIIWLVFSSTLIANAQSRVLQCIFDIHAQVLGAQKFLTSSIPTFGCTHFLITSIVVQSTGLLDLKQCNTEDVLRDIVKKRDNNLSLSVIASIGGVLTKSETMSDIVRDDTRRGILIKSIGHLISEYKLDGVDIDWHNPNKGNNRPEDVANLILFLNQLREYLVDKRITLSVSLKSDEASIVQAAYEIPKINSIVNYIILKTAAYHKFGDGLNVTGNNAPLYSSGNAVDAQLNVDYSASFWIAFGASPNKLIISVSFFGSSFQLVDPRREYGLGAPVKGPGAPGAYLAVSGVLTYSEVCKMLNEQPGWTVVYDATQAAPFAYRGELWVGYDDEQSVRRKCEYAKCRGLAGVVIDVLAYDDLLDNCGTGSMPLLQSCIDGLMVYV